MGRCVKPFGGLQNRVLTVLVLLLTTPVVVSLGPSNGAAGPSTEKVLIQAYTRDIESLDPTKNLGVPDYPLLIQLYNGLVRYKPGTTEIEPDLAERYTMSRDGLTYTFNLRKGVKFHKGYGEVTARDVKYSFERVTNPTVKSVFAGVMGAIKDIQVVDDYTVRLQMHAPSADFLRGVLAAIPGYIVSRRAVEEFGDRYGLNPIGTGAYILEKHTPRQETNFVANKDYFRGKPAIDRVVFKVIPDETVLVLSMAKGDVDHAIVRTTEAFKLMKLYRRIDYTITPVTGVYAVIVNTKRAPLSDVRVRRALSYAIDRKEMLATALEGMGTIDGIWSVIPPNVYGHVGNTPAFSYDQNRSQTLLREAGQGNMRPLTFIYRTPHRSIVTALQGYWSKVGVRVNLEEMDDAALDARVRSGDWDFYWRGPFRVTPDQFLTFFLSSSSDYNFYGEIDDLILAQRREVSDSRRKAVLRNVQVRIASDQPTIPVYRPYLVTAFRRGIVTGDVPSTHYWLWYWELMDVKRN